MKYKVGEKVKVKTWEEMAKEYQVDSVGDIKIGTCEPFFVKGMKKFCGKTVTIKKVYAGPFGSERYYIEEDRRDPWTWCDKMFVSESKTSKFNVGDKVIGNKKANIYVFSNEGWIGKVTRILGNGRIRVEEDSGHFFDVDEDKFDLLERCDKKVVITVDGKTTLARLYEGDKVIRSAEAKCSPDDKFNFDVGAEIAFKRLIETQPAPVEEKPWSGKVICLDPKRNPDLYTKGKVYEVKNGYILKDDSGTPVGAGDNIKSFEDWNKWSSSEWLEVVE